MKPFVLRSAIFWSHLVVGVLAGIVILIMSATGVLLTYERQIDDWVERQYQVPAQENASYLSADDILGRFQQKHPDEHHFYIRYVNREGAARPVWAGDYAYLINPYSGEILREGEGATAAFFHFVTDLHRWLAIEGEGFDIARGITAYSNLLFIFLILSGIYLWLPRVWRWRALKWKILFNKKAVLPRARDYNWHHVFGFWALIPLLFIALTATIFYFPWANRLIYGAFGEEVPDFGGEPPEITELQAGDMSYQALLQQAQAHAAENGAEDWYSIWMEVGATPGEAEFYIDRSIGHRPDYAYGLRLDMDTAEVLEAKHHDDWSRGDQAWDIARFGHTGEWFGFAGQTVAGLASLAACFLVYTGLALAWRRLVSPLIRNK